jgi:hypothetical protein
MDDEPSDEWEDDRVAEYALAAFLDGASDEEIDCYLRALRASRPVT